MDPIPRRVYWMKATHPGLNGTELSPYRKQDAKLILALIESVLDPANRNEQVEKKSPVFISAVLHVSHVNIILVPLIAYDGKPNRRLRRGCIRNSPEAGST